MLFEKHKDYIDDLFTGVTLRFYQEYQMLGPLASFEALGSQSKTGTPRPYQSWAVPVANEGRSKR